MTSGVNSVTSGADRSDLFRGGLLLLACAGVVATINIVTTWVDTADAHRWEPVVWEVSSLIGLVCALWIPWLAAARAPADQLLSAGWKTRLHFVAEHGAAVVAYSVLHVAVFIVLRKLAYVVMEHGPYTFGDHFLYEFRKDILAYLLFITVFWGVAEVRRNRKDEVRPVSFDIRDGARIIRVPLNDILAVASAGNYVEFHLADGRKPLMRATLAAVEARLEPVGFVRSHRSWLVNPARMTGLVPVGSGDWTVGLGPLEAPLSRRYPQALERLRV